MGMGSKVRALDVIEHVVGGIVLFGGGCRYLFPLCSRGSNFASCTL